MCAAALHVLQQNLTAFTHALCLHAENFHPLAQTGDKEFKHAFLTGENDADSAGGEKLASTVFWLVEKITNEQPNLNDIEKQGKDPEDHEALCM